MIYEDDDEEPIPIVEDDDEEDNNNNGEESRERESETQTRQPFDLNLPSSHSYLGEVPALPNKGVVCL